MSETRSLVPRCAPETDEEVKRRIKRRKKLSNNEYEIRASLDKTEGEIKALSHRIISLTKARTKKEQEVKALREKLREAKEIVEDIDFVKLLELKQEQITTETKKFKHWIQQGGHRKITGFGEQQYKRVYQFITSGVLFNDALSRVVRAIPPAILPPPPQTASMETSN